MVAKNGLISLAKADVKMSELALSTTNDELMQNMAAYHTQQGIEKMIKHLLVEKRGHSIIEHDLGMLVDEAKSEGIIIPQWVEDNAYEISRWATTIRYNSNFRTNREAIIEYNNRLKEWISAEEEG